MGANITKLPDSPTMDRLPLSRMDSSKTLPDHQNLNYSTSNQGNPPHHSLSALTVETNKPSELMDHPHNHPKNPFVSSHQELGPSSSLNSASSSQVPPLTNRSVVSPDLPISAFSEPNSKRESVSPYTSYPSVPSPSTETQAPLPMYTHSSSVTQLKNTTSSATPKEKYDQYHQSSNQTQSNNFPKSHQNTPNIAPPAGDLPIRIENINRRESSAYRRSHHDQDGSPRKSVSSSSMSQFITPGTSFRSPSFSLPAPEIVSPFSIQPPQIITEEQEEEDIYAKLESQGMPSIHDSSPSILSKQNSEYLSMNQNEDHVSTNAKNGTVSTFVPPRLLHHQSDPSLFLSSQNLNHRQRSVNENGNPQSDTHTNTSGTHSLNRPNLSNNQSHNTRAAPISKELIADPLNRSAPKLNRQPHSFHLGSGSPLTLSNSSAQFTDKHKVYSFSSTTHSSISSSYGQPRNQNLGLHAQRPPIAPLTGYQKMTSIPNANGQNSANAMNAMYPNFNTNNMISQNATNRTSVSDTKLKSMNTKIPTHHTNDQRLGLTNSEKNQAPSHTQVVERESPTSQRKKYQVPFPLMQQNSNQDIHTHQAPPALNENSRANSFSLAHSQNGVQIVGSLDSFLGTEDSHNQSINSQSVYDKSVSESFFSNYGASISSTVGHFAAHLNESYGSHALKLDGSGTHHGLSNVASNSQTAEPSSSSSVNNVQSNIHSHLNNSGGAQGPMPNDDDGNHLYLSLLKRKPSSKGSVKLKQKLDKFVKESKCIDEHLSETSHSVAAIPSNARSNDSFSSSLNNKEMQIKNTMKLNAMTQNVSNLAFMNSGTFAAHENGVQHTQQSSTRTHELQSSAPLLYSSSSANGNHGDHKYETILQIETSSSSSSSSSSASTKKSMAAMSKSGTSQNQSRREDRSLISSITHKQEIQDISVHPHDNHSRIPESVPKTPILSRAIIRKPNSPHGIFKFSSCSSLFVHSTVSNSDRNQVLRCFALQLVSMIQNNSKRPKQTSNPTLSEQSFPISRKVRFCYKIPTEEEIYGFLVAIFDSADLKASHAVITMVYIQRMMVCTGICIQPMNWIRSVLGALLLSSKVWEDNAVWNVDFHQILPDWPVYDISTLERWYLYVMKFNVNVRPSEYTRAYFELNEFVKELDQLPISKPLTIHDIKEIEAKANEVKEAKPITEVDLETITVSIAPLKRRSIHTSVITTNQQSVASKLAMIKPFEDLTLSSQRIPPPLPPSSLLSQQQQKGNRTNNTTTIYKKRVANSIRDLIKEQQQRQKMELLHDADTDKEDGEQEDGKEEEDDDSFFDYLQQKEESSVHQSMDADDDNNVSSSSEYNFVFKSRKRNLNSQSNLDSHSRSPWDNQKAYTPSQLNPQQQQPEKQQHRGVGEEQEEAERFDNKGNSYSKEIDESDDKLSSTNRSFNRNSNTAAKYPLAEKNSMIHNTHHGVGSAANGGLRKAFSDYLFQTGKAPANVV